MGWLLTPVAALMFVSTAISGAVAWYAWRRRTAPGARAFVVMMLAATWYSLTAALEAGAVAPATKLTFSQWLYFGSMTVAVFYLNFVVAYGYPAHRLTPRWLALLLVIPAATILLVLTNDAHHLIWTGFAPGPPNSNLLVYYYGPWAWLSFLYAYVMMFAATVLLLRAIRYMPGLYRYQAIVLLVGALFPVIASVLYLFKLTPLVGVDLIPISLSLSGIAFAIGYTQFRLFDLVPIAREALIESMTDSMLVIDQQNRIADINPAALRLLGLSQAPIGQPVDTVFDKQRDLIEHFHDAPESHVEISVGSPPLYFDVHISPLRDRRGQITGRLVSLRDISDRRRAEEQLRLSEARLRQVIDLVPALIYAKDSTGRLLLVNQAMAEAYATTVDEAVGKTYADLNVLPEDWQRFLQEDQAIIQSGQPLLIPSESITDAHGEVHYQQTTKIPFTFSGTDGPAVLGVSVDMTARKRVEDALRASEALYHALVETLPLSVFRKDLEGRFTFANSRYCEMEGRTLDQIIGRTDYDLHPRELAEKYRADDQRIMAAGQPQNFVEEHQPITGEKTYVQVFKAPLYNADGQVCGLQGMFWDISDLKRTDAALAQRARELAALYETALEISAQVDLDHLLHAIVQRTADLLGARMGGLYLLQPDGHTLELVVAHNSPRQYWGAQLQLGEGLAGRVAQTGQPLAIDDYHVWPGRAGTFDKEPFQRVLGVPLKVGDRILGVLNVTDDQLTTPFTDDEIRLASTLADQAAIALEHMRLYAAIQQHAAELEQRVTARTRELTAAYEQLQALDRLKDQFVSRISHELRTPLANMRLYLNLLKMGKPEKHAEYVETLARETARLNKLIEDLLAISELDMGQVAINLGPIDLDHFIALLAPDWQAAAQTRHLSFEVQREPNLPPALTDAALLTQAVNNLVNNALNYTPAEGRIICTLGRCVADDEPWLTLTIADTGPGLAPEELPHLFERFYRGKAARNYKVPGTGLGLAIAQEIVVKLGGRLTVESEWQHGASFTIWLRPA